MPVGDLDRRATVYMLGQHVERKRPIDEASSIGRLISDNNPSVIPSLHTSFQAEVNQIWSAKLLHDPAQFLFFSCTHSVHMGLEIHMMTDVVQKGDALDRNAHLLVFNLTQDLMASLYSFHITNRP